MTYHYYGMGSVAVTTALPSFDSLTKEGVRYGVPWALVEDDPTLEQIKRILVAAKAMLSTESIRNPQGKLKDDGIFIDALRNLWIRNGRNPALWPEAFRDTDTHTINYNFGPTNNDGAQLRINQAMWQLLQNLDPNRPWSSYHEGKEGEIGHVRVRLGDTLLQHNIRGRLVELGYLPATGVQVSVSDGSGFSEALKRYYAEAREQGLPVGSWAGWTDTGGCGTYDVFGACQNYGPNTDGDQIRLHTDLIDSLVNKRHNPRIALATRGAQTGVAATRTKPPLYGSLPGETAPVALFNKSLLRKVYRPAISASAQSVLMNALKK